MTDRQNKLLVMENLSAHTIPLFDKHLIEASAGTGKTFNITRLYLRLLLERKIPVEQILVMTFTKDATEEIRGRIDGFIREALNNWQSLIIEDEYFTALSQKISSEEARIRLEQALLFLDEAAIFTIHGFCKRVLSQHAFASGIVFNAQMETDCQDIILQACQDWYRVLAKESAEDFKQVTLFWQNPQSFLKQFSKAIAKHSALDVVDVIQIEQEFQLLVTASLTSIQSHQGLLSQALIEVKKGSDRELRQLEYQQLVDWLIALSQDMNIASSKMPDAFFDGKRYAKSVHKSELLDIFSSVKQLKSEIKTLDKKLNKAKALTIVREGIYQVRENIIEQKLTRNILSFDDLISTLAQCLNSSNSTSLTLSEHQIKASSLAQIIFQQYPVALVDEFQDTDPLQFSILESIYYQQPEGALYMIGDPKQAIYGFRGGDVFAYLSARKNCDHRWLMDTNWRSSAAMISGYNRLFYGRKIDTETFLENGVAEEGENIFGYNIPYSPVKASPKANDNTFTDEQFQALQFIHFDLNDDVESKNKKAKSVKQSFRPVMATWCANEIIRLLSTSHDKSISLESREIESKDIAILVRDGTEAAEVKLALDTAGLASVFMSNRANLLKSEETQQLIRLLKGILFVEDERLFSAAITSSLLAYPPQAFYQLQQDELAWQSLKLRFIQLRNDWLYQGFIAMALKLMHEHFSLPDENQDRMFTNLLHLFEILQTASQRHRQPQELLFWFEQQSRDSSPEVEAELRLESDDDLIRIITQHGSKGMEYPVVFVPFATRHKDPLKFGSRSVDFIEYHNNEGHLKLSLDGSDDARAAMADEAYAEAIRLLYVAITRAEQRCYLLSTAFDQAENSPLGRTLKWKKDQNIVNNLTALVQDAPDAIGLLTINSSYEDAIEAQEYGTHLSSNKKHSSSQVKSAELDISVACFDGKIERNWWLSSFTALSKNLRHGGVSSPDRDNTQELSANIALSASNTLSSSLLRFTIAKGAHTGNLLHDILEDTDFSAPDWANALHWPLLKYGELTEGFDHDDLQQWLNQIIQTPLTSSGELTLSSLTPAKTLREIEFYYPMNSASSDRLACQLTQHRNVDKNESDDYLQSVKLPAYHQLKGMMHGFVDLIFEHNNQYFVCDYKSSHLGDEFEHYTQDNMRLNIEKNHYDLQYLIYSLALHRYLRHALPDYDAKQHFGGIYYLYLRGMTDDPDHRMAGVYHREISIEELEALDVLFEGKSEQGEVNSV
jgi:exodeoxyribonuclease V beta subunit